MDWSGRLMTEARLSSTFWILCVPIFEMSRLHSVLLSERSRLSRTAYEALTGEHAIAALAVLASAEVVRVLEVDGVNRGLRDK